MSKHEGKALPTFTVVQASSILSTWIIQCQDEEMLTNILLGLILLALVFIGFMVFVLGRMIDERLK